MPMRWRDPEGRIKRRTLSLPRPMRLGRTIILPAMMVGLLLLLFSSVRADFDLSIARLSDQDSTCDIEPRAAISDDGQWLAVVWINGLKKESGGCKSQGQAQIRWATETSGASGWQGPYTLPLPTGACAVHADVDVIGTTAHVVVSYWQPCEDPQADSHIGYFTCNLEAGACNAVGDAVSQDGSEGLRLFDARLAADAQGRLHLIYSKATHGLLASDIYYTRYTDGDWTSPVKVSTGEKYDGFYRPAAAVSGNRVHITWERHRNTGGTRYRDVQHRYCETPTGACGPLTTYYPCPGLEATGALPTVAARHNRVMLAWNVCADIDPNPPCESFYLLYARSDDNGTSFSSPKEIGSDYGVNRLDLSTRRFAGNDGTAPGEPPVHQYAAYARPVIALNGLDLPYVAWQIKTAQGYVISTTHAIAATSEGFNWKSEDGWQLGAGVDARVAPAILLPDELADNGMHFFHMLVWQEQIGSQLASRSQIYYDYVGARRPSLTTEITPTTHPLPAERAVQLKVRVRDGNGANMAGERIVFATDHGSFDYLGFGAQQIEAVSDAEGTVSRTLYSNMTGTATCRAWIDSIPDGVWNVGEPTLTFTQTWIDPMTSTVQIGAAWVGPGDLITATLAHHPYEIPSFAGAAAQYLLWLCPGATQVAGPLSVDIESWAKQDLMIQVPWDTDNGIHHLESRVNEEGMTPCVGADYVARSPDIQVSTSPPPGPWLVVGNNRPPPGTPITTTLLDHEAGTYELWWCPASSRAAPVSQKLGDVTVASGAEPTVEFTVPMAVEGLYRLETHTGSGACGDTRTRYAVSALLHPLSEVFLPLITRASR